MRKWMLVFCIATFVATLSGCGAVEHKYVIRNAEIEASTEPIRHMFGPTLKDGEKTVLVFKQEGYDIFSNYKPDMFERFYIELPKDWKTGFSYDLAGTDVKVVYTQGHYENFYKVNERQEGHVYVYEDRNGLLRACVCGVFYLRTCNVNGDLQWQESKNPLEEYLICGEFHFKEGNIYSFKTGNPPMKLQQ